MLKTKVIFGIGAFPQILTRLIIKCSVVKIHEKFDFTKANKQIPDYHLDGLYFAC